MRSRRAALIVLVAAPVLGFALLSFPPPRRLLRALMVIESSHLLAPPSQSRLLAPIQKIVSTYFELAIAGRMAVVASGAKDDVTRIDEVCRGVQRHVLNPNQVPHTAHSWPALIAGFGYCDQVNSAACEILARSFEKAELFALYDPRLRSSPHTVGRVWSNQRRDWLYFDCSGDRPVVFRRAGGAIAILNAPQVTSASRLPPPMQTYALPGWVLNRYASNYPAYLTRKAYAAIFERRSIPEEIVQGGKVPQAPEAPPAAAPPATESAPPAPAQPPPDRAAFARIAGEYVRARADDLLGDPKQAKASYRAIAADADAASDPAAAPLQLAAREFAGQ